jgi:arsenate reductase
MRSRFTATLFLIAMTASAKPAGAQTRKAGGHSVNRSAVVFVCEHGAALSVVSAAYFNQLAREQHLNLHAVARGAAPQKDISVSASAGLKADGVPFETKRPQALAPKDAAHALRIIAFCPLPVKYSGMAHVETWDGVPATSVNYGLARDAILEHLKELIRQLKRDGT